MIFAAAVDAAFLLLLLLFLLLGSFVVGVYVGAI
jgi:hypothetical protein